MAISVESIREHTAELAAILSRLGERLGSLAEDQAAQALSLFRSEMRRAALAIAFALTTAFFACAAGAMAIFSILLALWMSHRVLGGALAASLCLLLAIGSALGVRRMTRPVRRERTMI